MSIGGLLADIQTGAALLAQKSACSVLNALGQIARPAERKRRPTNAGLVALRDHWATRRRVVPIWAITKFAAATGMRLGEIYRIRWDDLERTARTVVIRDRKHPRSKKCNDQTVPLLRGPVTIDGEVIDPMEIIAEQHRADDRIFPFSTATTSTAFTRGVTACGFEDLRFHDLRHHAVSLLFEHGFRIKQVALVSGHQDWKMLRRYTHLTPASLHHHEVAQ